MTVPTRQAQSTNNGLNGNGGGSGSGAGSTGIGGAMRESASLRMSFDKQQSMRNMNMLEAGNQFYQLKSESDFIVNNEDGVDDSYPNNDNSEDISDDDQAEKVHNTPSGSKRKRDTDQAGPNIDVVISAPRRSRRESKRPVRLEDYV